MTWTCPHCKRTFKTKVGYHSCIRFTVDAHFEDKPESIRELYTFLHARMRESGEFDVEAVQGSIIWKNPRSFVNLKIMKQWIDITFSVHEPIDSPRVQSVSQYSKYRYIHVIRVTNEEEIDDQLMDWLDWAYELELD